MGVVATLLLVVALFFMAYMVFVAGANLALLVMAFVEVRQHRREVAEEPRWHLDDARTAPSVSFFLPAYNESKVIVESVRNFLTVEYPNFEVICINDGSTDDTLEILKEAFDLVPVPEPQEDALETEPVHGRYHSRIHPNLVVIDKENGGKADSLNAAMNRARGDYFLAMDADTLLEPDALQRMVRPFMADPMTLAVGGTVRLVNGCRIDKGRVKEIRVPKRLIVGMQVVEYVRAFLQGRIGLNRLGGNLIISGAFGLFHRDSALAHGGFSPDAIGEDMEMVVRMTKARRRGKQERWKIAYEPDAVAWTEAPEAWRELGSQRSRWHQGLQDVITRHRTLFFNPRYGLLGLFGFPFFVLVEFLGPVVQALGIIATVAAAILGLLNLQAALFIFLAAYGFGLTLTAAAILIDETVYGLYEGPRQRLRMFAFALAEAFFYQPLSVWWRLGGIVRYFRGSREWGEMTRGGYEQA